MTIETLKARYDKDASLRPRHVAIIMDGNGRWAKSRFMPRSFGHKRGVERVRDIVRASSDLGIEALTLFAFSTENWKRPKDEVGFLMNLLMEYLKSEIEELNENDVVFRVIGDRDGLTEGLITLIEDAEAVMKDNTGLKLNIAINYGGKHEVYKAAEAFAKAYQTGEALTQALFESYFYTAGLPDVDFMIRTSGEQRISNFLLYQAAYAELYFADDHWPDFSPEVYADALLEYINRERRYGGSSS